MYSSIAFANHEQVSIFYDEATQTKAIIAIHDTTLGPALGGCRMFPYASEQDALDDVLRLAEGMSYKAALANLPQGGGKSVIIGDPRQDKSTEMMLAMGRFVDSCGGRYIVAEDSGISVSDVRTMATVTEYAGGYSAHHRYDGAEHDGNPAPATAYGVFVGIQAAVRYKLNSDLTGLTIAIQGAGQVGRRLAQHCLDAGARVLIADVYAPSLEALAEHPEVTLCDVHSIHAQKCDVFAPCALGGAINRNTIEDIRAKIIAGAANNQLAEAELGDVLTRKNILYAPDFVINAGGIIDIHHQALHSPAGNIKAHLEQIGNTLNDIFAESDTTGLATSGVALNMAKRKIAAGKR
jgi:leucine dehydrogenase